MGAPGSRAGSRGRPARPERPEIEPGHGSAGRERPLAGPGRRCRPRVPITGRTTREGSRTRCFDCCTPQTSTSARATRTSARPPRPSASGSSPRSAPPWTSRSPRRSTCSSSPATCSTRTSSPSAPWSAWPPSSRGSPRPASARSSCPGTHDVYDRSSVYRAYDLAAMAGTRPAEEMVTVLTPDHPWVHLAALDAVVHGPCFPTKRAPRSPLHDLAAVETPDATWHIGVLHASVAIPGPHRSRRGRGHGRGDRRQRPRLPRARPLALRAGRQDQGRHLRLRRRARSRSPSTRTRPARCSS